MTLYFCAWDRDDGPASLLVDAGDEKRARQMARDTAGEEPRRCLVWASGVFVAELAEEETDEDGLVEIVLLPAGHVAEALILLEEAGETTSAKTIAMNAPQCGAEAEDDAGQRSRCVLVEDHEGDHRDTGGDTWRDE
jgi:hypothetical protein